MRSLVEYVKSSLNNDAYIKSSLNNDNIMEALESNVIDNLEVTYAADNIEIYVDAPETYQEDDIHQFMDDLLLSQMPSDPEIAKKFFRNNVKYINDAYFEYDGFERLSYKRDIVDIKYSSDLGKDVSDDVKIVTFKLKNLRFKIIFSKFEIMIDDNTDIDDTLDTIFSAYESNNYNDTDVTFKYDFCEYDR